jgi:hypothetical protein
VTSTAPRSSQVGRDAGAGRRDGFRGRRRDGFRERSMVPRAEFTSYYGRPVLHEPTWQARDIAGYLFLGGLAGASSLLGAGGHATGRPALARAAKLGAAGAIGLSLAALVHDLGRPARFANMLRVFKPTSPMSVGSWLLAGYGPMAAAAALCDATGRLPRLGALATTGAAGLGSGVAAYTAVLVADTAVPAWHDGYREMPFVFVGSAAAAAGGLGMAAAPVGQAGPARRAALLGAATELAATRAMHRRLGFVAEPYRTGTGGRLMRVARVLTVAGAVGAGTVARRSRTGGLLSGLALLAGSAVTRFGVFRAGVDSTRDPKYVVRPQRERLSTVDGNG